MPGFVCDPMCCCVGAKLALAEAGVFDLGGGGGGAASAVAVQFTIPTPARPPMRTTIRPTSWHTGTTSRGRQAITWAEVGSSTQLLGHQQPKCT